MQKQNKSSKGQDRSPESQHVQKGFFTPTKDAQNKYAQGQVTK